MKMILLFLLALAAAQGPVQALDRSPQWAARGEKAFREGRYDLARFFFVKSLEDALLRGEKGWTLKALVNLVDLEMETGRRASAESLLTNETLARSLSGSAGPEGALLRWKKAQVLHRSGASVRALAVLDSALSGPLPRAWELALKRDRFRFEAALLAPEAADDAAAQAWKGWWERWRAFVHPLKPREKEAGLALEAEAWLRRGRPDKSLELWSEWERRLSPLGRPAPIAEGRHRMAVCLFLLGKPEEARSQQERALGIYRRLGAPELHLRALALALLLEKEESSIAKLKVESDLVQARVPAFDFEEARRAHARFLSLPLAAAPLSGLAPP